MRRAALAGLLSVALCTPAFATSKESLRAAEQQLKASEQKQRDLAKQQGALAKELRTLQNQLVQAAADIQKNEQRLAEAVEKLDDTRAQLSDKETQIKKNQGRLETLVNVAFRFSRMPPEAMVMMPNDSQQTLRVSKALAMLSHDIKEETRQLHEQKQDLQQLQKKFVARKLETEQRQEELEAKRAALQARITERKRLHGSLIKDQQQEVKKARQLASKAEDLQDLIGKLATQRQVTADASPAPSHASRGTLRSFKQAKGKVRMPVTGTLKKRYGVNASKGVTVATAPLAQVVAPYDAEVIFAGTFLNYGRMTILRHSDDFHTLLAGFSQLDVKRGEFLLEGEPIGAMGSSKAQKKLYVELRKNNQPINPGPWIRGLK